MNKGIQMGKTAPYSPSQNGVAEQLNQMLLDLAQAMIISLNKSGKFNSTNHLWTQAIDHAIGTKVQHRHSGA